MTSEIWPKTALTYLKKKFREYSNIELSALLNKRWKRLDGKAFTGLNVNHKLSYLGLKRTKREKEKISKRCYRTGVYKTTSDHRSTAATVGDIFVRVKEGRVYIAIKIAEKKFRPLKNVVYEKRFGKIPVGSYVDVIDGDELNCHRDNLILQNKYEKAQALTQQLGDVYAAGILAKGKPGYKEFLLTDEGRPQLEHWKANVILRRVMAQQGIKPPQLPISRKVAPYMRKTLAWPPVAKRYVRMYFRRLSDIELVARLNAKYIPKGAKVKFTTVKVCSFRRHNKLSRTKEESKYIRSRNVKNGSYKGIGKK